MRPGWGKRVQPAGKGAGCVGAAQPNLKTTTTTTPRCSHRAHKNACHVGTFPAVRPIQGPGAFLSQRGPCPTPPPGESRQPALFFPPGTVPHRVRQKKVQASQVRWSGAEPSRAGKIDCPSERGDVQWPAATVPSANVAPSAIVAPLGVLSRNLVFCARWV